MATDQKVGGSNPLTHVLKEGRNSLKNKGFDFFVLKFTPVLFGVICKLLQKTKTLMKQIKENLYSIWIHIPAQEYKMHKILKVHIKIFYVNLPLSKI